MYGCVSILTRDWHGAVRLGPISWQIITYVSYTVNSIAADGLATQGA